MAKETKGARPVQMLMTQAHLGATYVQIASFKCLRSSQKVHSLDDALAQSMDNWLWGPRASGQLPEVRELAYRCVWPARVHAGGRHKSRG